MSVINLASIAIGDELPVLVKPAITRATLAYFCGASNDHNPIHVDADFARAAGKEDVFAHGMLDMAYMGQLLTNWVPQQSIICFEVKFKAIVYVGDQITCHGVVDEVIETDDGVELKISLKAENQHHDIKLTGQAIISVVC